MIDLHTHSTFSDGTRTPAELVAAATRRGLSALALTDHDTVAGIPDFLGAPSSGTELIAGVELSASFSNREIHLVGVFIDCESEPLNSFLRKQRDERRRRNEEIRRKLTALGYPISWDEPEFSVVADFSNIGRPHFARVLCRKFGFPSFGDVFGQLLGRSRPAYVRRQLPMAVEALSVIHVAGGVAVWAHPFSGDGSDWSFIRRCAKRLSGKGLDAMECRYRGYATETCELLSDIAKSAGLARSGGSDFHDDADGRFEIGTADGTLEVPDAFLEELRSISARHLAS